MPNCQWRYGCDEPGTTQWTPIENFAFRTAAGWHARPGADNKYLCEAHAELATTTFVREETVFRS